MILITDFGKTLEPATLAAWHRNPTNAVVLIVAFYAMMITVLASTIFLFGTTHFLGPSGRRTLILVSAIMLAMLGVFQLATSLLRAWAA